MYQLLEKADCSPAHLNTHKLAGAGSLETDFLLNLCHDITPWRDLNSVVVSVIRHHVFQGAPLRRLHKGRTEQSGGGRGGGATALAGPPRTPLKVEVEESEETA
ncbi:hypothetical protein CgunFtcFv8_003281 [Champsocephalus gunnari]|uniref:Uncharacterized protein n=1 Tax=Champsocephalus gunnari TaxID=52237 RepID=A0AAN8D8E3_CHAGU|nr:hypothetical protein CgunFtcFv8_003281 [Champsocephalus gunnari]